MLYNLFNFLKNKKFYLMALFVYLVYLTISLLVGEHIISLYSDGAVYFHIIILLSSIVGIPLVIYQLLLQIQQPYQAELEEQSTRNIGLYNVFLSLMTTFFLVATYSTVIYIKIPLVVNDHFIKNYKFELILELVRNVLYITSLGIILEVFKYKINTKVRQIFPKILLSISLFLSMMFRHQFFLFSSISIHNGAIEHYSSFILQISIGILMFILALICVYRFGKRQYGI